MLKNIHDYVKENYEAGNYDNAKAAYTSWETEKDKQTNLSDFEMGVQKAQNDYKQNRTFATYPKLAIGILNKLFGNKASEISEFIHGYNSYKSKFRNY
ncbi:hypothetical protein DS830_05190 [Bombilactobacillus bombi]|uniref:hypothetical protein n=1 Tax=Bombilactobacillus bombi TaxID=1303590 RepID=UPI000E58452C|nr:hypothetical protein [Bombilactobacillus bombi]AXX64904.1 hypothetical protein DS830_05190 [Bombilactobacillus bombi]